MPQPSRQSVRCGGCTLVQFMTKDELCRRCHDPLTLIKYLDINFPVWRIDSGNGNGKVLSTLSASADKPCHGNFSRRLGARLKALRLSRGLRRDQMQKVMQASSMSRVETGKHYPSIAVLEKYSDALKVSVAEILNGDFRVTDELLDDPLVAEIGLYLRNISWRKWIEVVVVLKKMNMNMGTESLRFRAQLEREYCQGV